jgi:hypothetical protein
VARSLRSPSGVATEHMWHDRQRGP